MRFHWSVRKYIRSLPTYHPGETIRLKIEQAPPQYRRPPPPLQITEPVLLFYTAATLAVGFVLGLAFSALASWPV